MPKVRSAPIANSSQFTRTGNTSLRLRDRDLLYNVSEDLSKTYGPSIRIPCNPRLWPNTRAKQESLGWQTYLPHSLTIRISPAVATTSSGQVIGGSLSTAHNVKNTYFPNAVMAVPGSQAVAVWEKGMIKFDLSILTQLKYNLNDVSVEGTPICAYIMLPSAFRGMIEIIYDISFFGHSTSDQLIPVYDLIPRTITQAGTATMTGQFASLTADEIFTFCLTGNYAGSPYLTANGGTTAIIDKNNMNTYILFQKATDVTCAMYDDAVTLAGASGTMDGWLSSRL